MAAKPPASRCRTGCTTAELARARRPGMIQNGRSANQRPDPPMSSQVLSELAPTGVLRAAINMGNFLLVTGRRPSGDPTGVSADIAAAIAARLGVPVKYVPYARPGGSADDAEKG